MANQRSYQSTFSYSQEHNQPSCNQYDNRGNFGSQGRDYFSPSRQDDSENFGNQGRDYSSNHDRQDGRRNFGNQGRDYSSNPDRQDGRRNFGNQGRDYSSNPPRQDGLGNFGYQAGAYSSNYDEGYSMNQNKGTSFNKIEGNNFYKGGRDYFCDNYASKSNQYSTPSSSIKLDNPCDEQMVFNDDRFSNCSQYASSSQASNQQRQNKNQPQSSSGQFGQVKQNTFDDNNLPSGQLIQTQRDNFEDESNVEMGGNSEEGGNFEEEHNNDEQTFTNTVQDCIEDECDGSDDEDIPEKVNAFVPSQELVEKFKYFPPSAEEMGNMLKGLVIYVAHNIKKKDKNPFVIICESFNRSDRFAPLEIEDSYNREDTNMRYCTIRWNGIMMVRGVGYSGKLTESRVVAAVELINNLAKSCYVLKMKDKYYSAAAFKELLEKGTDESDTVRIVQEHEAPDLESAKNYIINFFKDDNDHELLFVIQKCNSGLNGWAKSKGYEVRSVNSASLHIIGVSIRRFPQYWRDKILASGKMENERFELFPPQGMGKQPLEGFDITAVIKRCIKSGCGPQSNEEKTKYANKDAGLNIAGLPSTGNSQQKKWKERWTQKRREMRAQGTWNSYKDPLNRVERAIQGGHPEAFAKAFGHLKKKLKKEFLNNCYIKMTQETWKSSLHLKGIERAIQEGLQEPEAFAEAFKHLNKIQKMEFINNLNVKRN